MAENTENQVAENTAEPKPEKEKKKKSRKKKKSLVVKIIVIVLILLIAAAAGFFFYQKKQAEKIAASMKEVTRSVVPVRRGEISNKMTSSGTLSPKDTYGDVKEYAAKL